MTDDYPRWICLDCGLRWGRRVPERLTVHRGHCEVCGREHYVTHEQLFFGLRDGWREGRPDAGGFVELDECTELRDEAEAKK